MANYNFPAEQPQFYSRLVFSKYERAKPGSDTTVTSDGIIRLPLPTQLADDFNIGVNQVGFGMLGNAMQNGVEKSVLDAYASGKSTIEDIVSSGWSADTLKKIGLVAAKAAAVTPGVSDTLPGQYAQSQFGMVRNPHLTTIFDGVHLKTYTFTWRLSPTSSDEAIEINNMINYIKACMHPKIIAEGFALEYPYIATLNFEVGGTNSLLPKVRNSFITKLDVNSTTGGHIAFYRDGQPSIVDVTINLQEIDALTRADFDPNL